MRVQVIWYSMGSGGSTLDDATFHPLPYDYRWLGLVVLLLQEVVCLHGLPLGIVSDWGPQSGSTFWGHICNHLRINWNMSTLLHPQSDGRTEQVNASIEQYLWIFVSYRQEYWAYWIPLAEFAANNGSLESTKSPTFFPIQGVDPWMSFAGEPSKEWDQWHMDTDQVQEPMGQTDEHLWVEIRWSQAIQ